MSDDTVNNPDFRYNLLLKLDGQNYDLPASSYAFIIQDSIFSLYPKGKISFNDKSGIMNELMAFINGNKIDISFGVDNNILTCPFGIIRNSIPDQENSMAIGGHTDTPLVHHYYFNQSKINKAYNKEMSLIVRDISAKYPFSSTDIRQTVNKGIWYQPNISDAEFLQQQLLPLAYALGSDETPFYSFIDLNNTFHFQNYKTLFTDTNSVDTIFINMGAGTPSDFTRNAGYIFTPTQASIQSLKEVFHKKTFKINNSGSLDILDKIITDYYIDPSMSVPIRWDTSLVTSTLNLIPDDIIDPDNENNNLGKINNSMRDAYHLDKMIVVCNFNPNYKAGKPIDLYIPFLMKDTGNELSTRYSGKYLIETSYHKWDGRNATTILVLSRQAIKNNPEVLRNKQTIKKV